MSYAHLIDAIEARYSGPIDFHLVGYVTEGGTYVIASTPVMNDDDRPHDLVAVLPTPVEGSRVLALRPTVNPDLVTTLRKHLDADLRRIVLDFECDQTLGEALDHIGDENAPVGIAGGAVHTQGEVFALWDGFHDAIATTSEAGA